MKTKIILEECYDETYICEFTIAEMAALAKIFDTASESQKRAFGKERFNVLHRYLKNIEYTYNCVQKAES